MHEVHTLGVSQVNIYNILKHKLSNRCISLACCLLCSGLSSAITSPSALPRSSRLKLDQALAGVAQWMEHWPVN